jgi:hypothetical protein
MFHLHSIYPMENASHVKRVPDAFGTSWHHAQKVTPSDPELGVASNEVNRRDDWYGLGNRVFGGMKLQGSRTIIRWRFFED